jgi:Fur family peroxide stress response transcriptional regulator
MNNTKDNNIDFKDILRKNNLKLTPQRQIILEALFGDYGHPSSTTVYEKIKDDNPSMSFDTVNRTLILFAEKGLIKEAVNYGRTKRYDTVTTKHHHFCCIKCGCIIDFNDKMLDELHIKTLKRLGDVVDMRVSIDGICKNCKTLKKSKKLINNKNLK